MARTPDALIEPAILIWARESLRLETSDVAARMKVDESRVIAWETGTERVSIAQLRKLAEIYQRPVAVFFLSEPPRDFDALRDFRRLQGDEPVEASANLRKELRRTQELREAALSLVDDESAIPAFPIAAAINEDAEAVAKRIREALGITDEAQLSWREPYRALREWRTAAESLGVLVVNMSKVAVDEARGFSIAHFPTPLIALNSKDTANGREFTLAHELVHLALREGGICEWSKEQRLNTDNRRIESYCNRVASAVLLPAVLVERVIAASVVKNGNWPDELLSRYARALSVSEEAFLRRLVTLGYATHAFYAAKRQEYLARYAKASKKRSKIVVSPERRVISRLGFAYLDLAFGAYYARRLSLSELSSYTGVRVGSLGKVEREAFGIARTPAVDR